MQGKAIFLSTYIFTTLKLFSIEITMKLFTSILMVVCVDLILGSNLESPAYWDSPVQFCGSALTIHMSVICRGWYNENSLTRLHQLMKRGIVDDCCKIPCTRRFVKHYYCGTPPKQTTPKITVTTKPTTTEPPSRIKPIDYNMYYFALIGRVLADPKDYSIH